MGHIHHDLQYHVVFSTKNRHPYLTPEKILLIQSTAAELAANLRFTILALNGYVDHLHILLQIPPRLSVAMVIKRIKGRTSREIGELYWQVGYWVTVVEAKNLKSIEEYINRQWQAHENRLVLAADFFEP